MAANGDLYDVLAKTGRFSEDLARHYIMQLLDGLDHIYNQGFVHRDLKLENLMIDSKFDLKIIDFDTVTGKYGKNFTGLLDTYCGTRNYMAPEMLKRKVYVGEKVDMFAVGVILFMMVTGCAPFQEAKANDGNYKHIHKKNFDKFWAIYQSEQNQYSVELMNLINHLLSEDSSQRPTLQDLASHPWFYLNKDTRGMQRQAKIEMKKRFEQI